MADPRGVFKCFLSLAGCAVGFSVFGWLRYYWVQHEVAWRPENRFWQYALTVAMGLACLCLSRGKSRLRRLVGSTWPVGVAGFILAALQWRVALREPWLLYVWMALLTWGAWLVSPRLRLTCDFRKRAWFCILVATLGMAGLHVAMQLELWKALSFGYRHIGLFVRALHSAANGQGLWVDSLGRSILGEHAFFGLWLLVPLCRLGADPFLLLVALSPVCLNGSALIVAWYVRRRFGSNVAAVLAALAWLLLPMNGTLTLAQGYGFHAVYLAVPLLLAGLALGGLGRWRTAAVGLLLCMAIREDIALTVAAWGVYVFWVERQRVLGLLVTGLSIGYLILAVFVIVPHYRGEAYPHIAFHFRELVGDGDLIRTLATNASFLMTLLLPLAFLPFRHWRWCLVALPSLAEAMLTTNVELHNICFQDYAPAMVVLFFAGIEGWHGMVQRNNSSRSTMTSPPTLRTIRRRDLRPGVCLFVAALVGQVYLGVGPLSNNPVRPFSHPALRADMANIQRARSLVPTNAGVTASYRIAAHFLDADRLWTVRNTQLGDFIIVHDADYIDEYNPREALLRALRSGAYQPVFANYHLVALVRQEEPTPLAHDLMPQRLPAGVSRLSFDLGQGIRLVGMGLQPLDEVGKHRVTLIWERGGEINDDYRFGLTLNELRWGPFYFARGAYPSSCWKSNQFYRDEVDIVVPGSERENLRSLAPVLLK